MYSFNVDSYEECINASINYDVDCRVRFNGWEVKQKDAYRSEDFHFTFPEFSNII